MLLDSTSPTRQLVAVSATIPPRTETLMRALMHDPILVAVGDMGAPVTNVVQTIVWAAEAVPAWHNGNSFAIFANQRIHDTHLCCRRKRSIGSFTCYPTPSIIDRRR